MGCAREARLLVGRQPGRRLAAPAARRGRARLAGAARARGALARGDGGGVRGRRREPAVRRAARLRRHRPRRAHARRGDRVPVHRRGARRGARATGRTSGSSTRSRPTGTGTCSSGGSPACRRRPCSRSRRTIVTVEEIVDELEPRPGAVVLPRWVIDAVALRAGRRAPVVRARLLRPRQRVLRRVGRDQPRPRHVHGVDARTSRTSLEAGVRPRERDGYTPTR